MSRETIIVCNFSPRFMYPAKPHKDRKITCLHRLLAYRGCYNENVIVRDFLHRGWYKAIENVTDVTVHGWMLLDRVKWLWRKPATSAFSLWSHETVRVAVKKKPLTAFTHRWWHKPCKFPPSQYFCPRKGEVEFAKVFEHLYISFTNIRKCITCLIRNILQFH